MIACSSAEVNGGRSACVYILVIDRPFAVATQLRAFSGEINGIALIHAAERELSGIAFAADEIAQRVTATRAVTPETTDSVMDLTRRVREIADANGDATYAGRLSVAASVLSTFVLRR